MTAKLLWFRVKVRGNKHWINIKARNKKDAVMKYLTKKTRKPKLMKLKKGFFNRLTDYHRTEKKEAFKMKPKAHKIRF